jgi:hypothetical protein
MAEEIDVTELSPDELSLLILTNDGRGPLPRHYTHDTTFVLTTKETYIWGIIISAIIQQNSNITERELSEAYRAAIRKNLQYLREYYSELPYEMPYRFPEAYFIYERLFSNIISTFQQQLQVQLEVGELNDRLKTAFRSLIKAKQIEDPIFTTIFGLSVAIAGFIPYGFTKKTKEGRTTYRKIEAVFWSYEKATKRGEVTTKVNFRLWKVLTAFKKALAETTAEEVERVR